jgi:hypothetical protein
VFLKCELKKEKNHYLIVENTNPKRNVTYKVESDIPNFYGPETIRVGPKQKEKYNFKVVPTLSGTYIGQVSFTEQSKAHNKQFYWYTVELKMQPPPA